MYEKKSFFFHLYYSALDRKEQVSKEIRGCRLRKPAEVSNNFQNTQQEKTIVASQGKGYKTETSPEIVTC